LLADIWTTAHWPPYLPELNLLDFSTWHALLWKGQVMSQAIAAEWDWLAAEYICKTCRSFHHRLEAIMAKNGAFIE
jgi:hypothetical protein